MSSTTSFNLLSFSDDPLYGEVYQILNRNYIGSWGDACMLYDKIRSDAIWSELTSMTSRKPNKGDVERASSLLEELHRFDTQTNIAKAESVVRTWSPPVTAAKPPLHPKTNTKTMKTTNSFAALNDDDDE